MTARVDIWVESAGLGHVTRQMNLVDHVRQRSDAAGVQFRFLVDASPVVANALSQSGHEIVTRAVSDEEAFRALDEEWMHSPPAVFILDSVDQDQNGKAHLVLADDQVFSVVVIDDPSDRDMDCDLLINALPSLKTPTEKKVAKRSLRGVEFLILPVEYAAIHENKTRRALGECDVGFAFFGGADLENFSQVFLDALSDSSSVHKWTLLLGPGYAFTDEIQRRVIENKLPVTVVRHVTSMGETLLNAHIAVLAAGNTLSEAAAVGTPAIVLSQNNVQAMNAEFFSATSGVIDLGGLAADSAHRLAGAIENMARDSERRRAMSEAMMSTVDGLGGRRIAELVVAEIKARQ